MKGYFGIGVEGVSKALNVGTLATSLLTTASIADLLRLCGCGGDRRLRPQLVQHGVGVDVGLRQAGRLCQQGLRQGLVLLQHRLGLDLRQRDEDLLLPLELLEDEKDLPLL